MANGFDNQDDDLRFLREELEAGQPVTSPTGATMYPAILNQPQQTFEQSAEQGGFLNQNILNPQVASYLAQKYNIPTYTGEASTPAATPPTQEPIEEQAPPTPETPMLEQPARVPGLEATEPGRVIVEPEGGPLGPEELAAGDQPDIMAATMPEPQPEAAPVKRPDGSIDAIETLRRRRGIARPGEVVSQEQLANAQKQARVSRLLAGLNQATKQVIQGITGAKQVDMTLAQKLREEADIPVKELQEKMELDKANFERQTKMDEAAAKSKFRDPNSPISIMYQNAARAANSRYNMGIPKEMMEKASAAEIAEFLKSNTTYMQLFNSELNAQRKADSEAQKSANKKAESARKEGMDWDKERRKWVDETRKNIGKSKEVQDLGKVLSQRKILEDARKNPGAFKDIASIFAFMKSIDPESVVRESEFANAAGAGSLLTAWKNKWSKMTRGEMLQDDQRQQLAEIAALTYNAALSKYNNMIAPVARSAVSTYQVHPSLVFQSMPKGMFNSLINEYGMSEEDLTKGVELAPEKHRAKPKESNMVKVKNLETGKTGSIPRVNLQKALESGKFEELK